MKKPILFVFLVVLWACSSGGNRYKALPELSSSSNEVKYETTAEDQNTGKEHINDQLQKVITERKLIKEGSISFETSNIERTRNYIARLTHFFKGYISRENSFSYEEQQRYDMTVRIPAELFDTFVDSLSVVMVKLENKDIQVKDVTEEYLDIEARLKSKKEILTRYTELLKQAKTVSEMLEIEREIGNIQTEIESFQGKLKYLQNQISYSTLHITFFEYRSAEFGFWSKIGNAFAAGWKGLLWFFIIMASLWPLWILMGVVVWIIRRLFKKKNSHLLSNK